MDKFEETAVSDDAFEKMINSMNQLEDQVVTAQQMGFDVIIPRNLVQFETALEAGKTIIVHSAEGSHQLGRNLTSAIYIQRLQELKEKGLALLTLSHFFKNDISDTSGGIPESLAAAIGYSVPPPVNDGYNYTGLSPIGHDVVDFCQEHGIILDLVHTHRKGRELVFERLKKRKKNKQRTRPVVFSHSGISEYAQRCGMTNPTDLLHLPSLIELEEIKKYNGVIGLVLSEYWINNDQAAFEPTAQHITKARLDTLETKYIVDLIGLINFVCGEIKDFEDNISIGTDMDGFSHVPDELRHSRFLYRLRDEFTKEFGTTKADKILSGNALRVIREGWS